MNKEHKPSAYTAQKSNGYSSLASSIRLVLSNWFYILIASTIAIIFWIVSSIFDQLLFFYPIMIFYLPNDAIVGFILANITAILLGIIVSMNVYLFRHSNVKLKIGSLFSGSSLGILSSACAGCSSIGFFLASTLGAAGVTASAFLSNYQTPLRIVSVAILIWAYYSTSKQIMKGCKLNCNHPDRKHFSKTEI